MNGHEVTYLRRVSDRPRQRPEPLWREAVGRQVRQERARRGERIVDVAARAGVAPQYLSEIERGRKDPSSEVLSALAGALEMSVLDLTSRALTHLVPAAPIAGRGRGRSGVSLSLAA